MYAQFRTQFPTGSLTSELIHMQQGHYVVRAIVQVGEVTLATGLSAAATVEQAEDQARSRALVVLGIESSGYAHLLESTETAAPARLNPAPQDLALEMPEPQAWKEPAFSELLSDEMALEEQPEPTPKGRRPAAKKKAPAPKVTPTAPDPIDLSDIIAQTDVELKRLGWTNTQGRQYLEQTYSKRSRQQLTDEELLEFLQTLQDLSVDEPPF
ncbi:MAG: hypothetical protein ACFCU8_05845 [Thermosynechococcaceae cyanobacterium]